MGHTLAPPEQLTHGATIVALAKPAHTPSMLLKQHHTNVGGYYETIQWGACVDLITKKPHGKGTLYFGTQLGVVDSEPIPASHDVPASSTSCFS